MEGLDLTKCGKKPQGFKTDKPKPKPKEEPHQQLIDYVKNNTPGGGVLDDISSVHSNQFLEEPLTLGKA